MIKIIQGDITTLSVDAIVNAAKRAVREVRGGSHAEARRR
jgi:O-acetyl-ADP-ribose deacetylase (regulator of RNase III)